MWKLNWLIKGVCLSFSNEGWDLFQDERYWLKNKTRPVTWTLKPDVAIQSRPQTFRSMQEWTIEKIKKQPFADVCRSADFFKIGCNTGVSCGHCKIFKNRFLTQYFQWLLLTALPRYSKMSWGACSLISRLNVLSILIKNFHETLHK